MLLLFLLTVFWSISYDLSLRNEVNLSPRLYNVASLNRRAEERGSGGMAESEWLTPGSPASSITTSVLITHHLSVVSWVFPMTQRFKEQSGPSAPTGKHRDEAVSWGRPRREESSSGQDVTLFSVSTSFSQDFSRFRLILQVRGKSQIPLTPHLNQPAPPQLPGIIVFVVYQLLTFHSIYLSPVSLHSHMTSRTPGLFCSPAGPQLWGQGSNYLLTACLKKRVTRC